MRWISRHPQFQPEMLGLLDLFLDDRDPRSAREQFDANYPYGSDWATEPWKMLPDEGLEYPGDPALPAMAETHLGQERVLFYNPAWVAIVQPDGAFVVQRMD